MTNAKRGLNSRRLVLSIPFLAGMSCCLCLGLLFGVAWYKETPGAEEPIITSETEVPLGSLTRPDTLAVSDWYDFSGRVLRDAGWTGSRRLTLFRTGFDCTESPEQPSLAFVELHVEDGYVDVVLPSVKWAYVGFSTDEDTAGLTVGLSRLSLPQAGMNPRALKVDPLQAFTIAQELGGKEFHESVSGACWVDLALQRNVWSVRYADTNTPNKPRWAKFEILIDAVTGSAKRRATP